MSQMIRGIRLHRNRRVMAGLVIGISAILALSACGGSPEAEDENTGGGSTTTVEPEVKDITIGILPVALLTPVWLAEKQGYFEDEGFDSVEIQFSFNIPDLISQAVQGNLDFAQTTFESGLRAVDNGLDIVHVQKSDSSTDGTCVNDRCDVMGLLTDPDSGVERPRDLEGETVAVSTVPGITYAFVRQVILDDGGDPDKVHFIEVPFPSMPDAIATGQVAAATTLEPYTTIAIDQGALGIAWPYVDVAKQELDLGGLATSRKFAEANPITVWKVVNAIQRAMDDMTLDEDFAREQIIEFSEISPEIGAKMWIPPFQSFTDPADVELQQDFMLDQGLLSGPIDIDNYLWESTLKECPRDICFYPSPDYEHEPVGVAYRGDD
jgi:NitT/TauT family transport system substrate-binding protein